MDFQWALWDGAWLCLEEPGLLLPKMALLLFQTVIPTLQDDGSCVQVFAAKSTEP